MEDYCRGTGNWYNQVTQESESSTLEYLARDLRNAEVKLGKEIDKEKDGQGDALTIQEAYKEQSFYSQAACKKMLSVKAHLKQLQVCCEKTCWDGVAQ